MRRSISQIKLTTHPCGKYTTAGVTVEDSQFPPPHRPPYDIAALRSLVSAQPRLPGKLLNLLDSLSIIRPPIANRPKVLHVPEHLVLSRPRVERSNALVVDLLHPIRLAGSRSPRSHRRVRGRARHVGSRWGHCEHIFSYCRGASKADGRRMLRGIRDQLDSKAPVHGDTDDKKSWKEEGSLATHFKTTYAVRVTS